MINKLIVMLIALPLIIPLNISGSGILLNNEINVHNDKKASFSALILLSILVIFAFVSCAITTDVEGKIPQPIWRTLSLEEIFALLISF